MFDLDTQKTYKGKTAGYYLKQATITKMAAGYYEITSPELRGCILELTDNDTMVVVGYDGVLVKLELSDRALAKMQALLDAAVNAYGGNNV